MKTTHWKGGLRRMVLFLLVFCYPLGMVGCEKPANVEGGGAALSRC